MQLKTILNRVEHYKSFVYGEPRWVDAAVRLTIEVPIEPRANGRPICSGCGKRRPGYDRLAPRHFEFVPLWQIAVVGVYALRRVDCPRCGVVVERVPWSTGKSRLTITYQWFKSPSNLLANSGDFSGVDTATLTINPAAKADAVVGRDDFGRHLRRQRGAFETEQMGAGGGGQLAGRLAAGANDG